MYNSLEELKTEKKDVICRTIGVAVTQDTFSRYEEMRTFLKQKDVKLSAVLRDAVTKSIDSLWGLYLDQKS